MKKEISNQELLEKLERRFDGVETILHHVSIVTQETRDIVDDLVPARKDHETRISALERSNVRLRLLVERK